jgi:hypothetical protein
MSFSLCLPKIDVTSLIVIYIINSMIILKVIPILERYKEYMNIHLNITL